MSYNKGSQMTSMQSPLGKIGYAYDKNGNLVAKQMGDKRDTYVYDAQDRLTAFIGYDGFEQRYSYDAMGLRARMEQKGNENRQTMEEMLTEGPGRAESPGRAPEAHETLARDAAAPDVDEWVKTSYINDVTLPYGQVLTETTAGKTTAYTYGLERISAQNGSLKTQYVYDGRGSVAQTVVSTPTAAVPTVKSFAYTPFGEMLGGKATGFGFNAEWYDAATGMQNLRARQYEPGMMRFCQKDLVRGNVVTPLSMNRYLYVVNDPVNLIDPTGHFAIAALMIGAAIIGAVVGGVVAYQTATVNKTATEKAKTATEAAKDKQNEAYLDWYLYCQNNYAFLSSTAKAEFDKARKVVGNVKPGATLTQKQREAILAACVAIVKAKEKEDDKRKMEDALSPADRAAGIRVVEINGKFYYDYSDLIDKRLNDAESLFKGYSVEDKFNKPFSEFNSFEMLQYLNDNKDKLMWFVSQVNNDMPWDLKEDDPWIKTMGKDIYMPGDAEKISYNGKEITREDLGNITYGYLGSAMGIQPELLHIAGGMVKQGADFGNVISMASAFLAAFEDKETWGDDRNDHENVKKGIDMYQNSSR